jgi:hypothetical protein
MYARAGMLLATVLMVASLAACQGDDAGDHDIAGSILSSDVPAEDVSEYPADADAIDDGGYRANDSASPVSADSFERKVIRSGELELVVSDVSRASRQARDLVADHGGHVAQSSARTLSEDEETAELAFEVPSEAFEQVLNDLREGSQVIRVEHESTGSQDVTEEYVDLESRLRNLESTEQRFVELLDDAYSISDVMSVENEISRIRGEIEQIQGRLNYLEQRTDFSRIYLSLSQGEESVTIAGQQFTPGESAREAWNASMEFIGTVGNAAITVVVFFWWAWPLLLLASLGISRYRRRANLEQPAT